jgi:hypothetical protein
MIVLAVIGGIVVVSLLVVAALLFGVRRTVGGVRATRGQNLGDNRSVSTRTTADAHGLSAEVSRGNSHVRPE